jgi:hypothetical protein
MFMVLSSVVDLRAENQVLESNPRFSACSAVPQQTAQRVPSSETCMPAKNSVYYSAFLGLLLLRLPEL